MSEKIEITVNGRPTSADVEPRLLLAHYLRDVVGLKATNIGCDTTSCGACTVLLDGRPISGCLTLAALAEGHELLTVEGLGAPGHLDVVQEAFLARTGFQCSYCTPGILLTTRALLAEHPDASDDEIREYLAGNLCRCGSYVKIVDSVREAIARLR